jgi:hypothetical protein
MPTEPCNPANSRHPDKNKLGGGHPLTPGARSTPGRGDAVPAQPSHTGSDGADGGTSTLSGPTLGPRAGVRGPNFSHTFGSQWQWGTGGAVFHLSFDLHGLNLALASVTSG